ncbi:MAG: flagellar protein FlgN [Myxococcales bacterium]|nr:flagellar protein FlgN [Myxococcales bacterium]
MANRDSYETLLTEEIGLLAELTQAEAAKHQSLINADMDQFDAALEHCDDLFTQIVEIDTRRKAAELKPQAGAVDRERLARWTELREQLRGAAESANEANQKNQRLLDSLLGEMKKQIDHVRAGRKALAGYGKGRGGSKPPTILSGDI